MVPIDRPKPPETGTPRARKDLDRLQGRERSGRCGNGAYHGKILFELRGRRIDALQTGRAARINGEQRSGHSPLGGIDQRNARRDRCAIQSQAFLEVRRHTPG